MKQGNILFPFDPKERLQQKMGKEKETASKT